MAGYPHEKLFEKQKFITSGKISEIKDFHFAHTLHTKGGSSGSPICLINNRNHNVIGIHKAGNKVERINYGTFIGYVLDILEKEKDNIVKIPTIIKLNPFSELGVDFNLNIDDFAKSIYDSFDKKVKNKKDFLCFFMIYNHERFKTIKNIFYVEKRDHFFYTIVNDLKGLKEEYGKNKYILGEKDNVGNNLLHLSVLGGYNEITNYLLTIGINFNEPNKYGKTALYYAKTYQKISIKILLEKYGAIDESYQMMSLPKGIRINSKDFDKISLIRKQLLEKGFIEENIYIIKKRDMIFGKRLMRKNIKNRNDLIKVYHGTRFVSIESIMNYGLK